MLNNNDMGIFQSDIATFAVRISFPTVARNFEMIAIGCFESPQIGQINTNAYSSRDEHDCK